MRNIIILLFTIFISFYAGYISHSKINYFDFSKFLPVKEKIAVKLSKDLIKTYNIPSNILDSSISPLYCMHVKTHIIKYYPKNKILSNDYNLNKNLHCIFVSEMKNAFNKIYYRDKPDMNLFLDNHIKGYTD